MLPIAVAPSKSVTVLAASAVPLTVTEVEPVNVGVAGAVICGGAGFVASIVNVTAALAELFARSVLETVTVCWPSASEGVVKGELQAFAAPVSILHLVAPGFASVALNWIVGVAVASSAAGNGCEIATLGWVESIVNVTDAVWLFDARSVLETTTVCWPSLSVLVVNGEVHALALAASSLQVVVPGFASVAEN
jgi:hypothetical protein